MTCKDSVKLLTLSMASRDEMVFTQIGMFLVIV